MSPPTTNVPFDSILVFGPGGGGGATVTVTAFVTAGSVDVTVVAVGVEPPPQPDRTIPNPATAPPPETVRAARWARCGGPHPNPGGMGPVRVAAVVGGHGPPLHYSAHL